MDAQSGHLKALLELEARHDDLLHRLADLDKRVQQVLARYTPSRHRDVTDPEQSSPPVQTP